MNSCHENKQYNKLNSIEREIFPRNFIRLQSMLTQDAAEMHDAMSICYIIVACEEYGVRREKRNITMIERNHPVRQSPLRTTALNPKKPQPGTALYNLWFIWGGYSAFRTFFHLLRKKVHARYYAGPTRSPNAHNTHKVNWTLTHKILCWRSFLRPVLFLHSMLCCRGSFPSSEEIFTTAAWTLKLILHFSDIISRTDGPLPRYYRTCIVKCRWRWSRR